MSVVFHEVKISRWSFSAVLLLDRTILHITSDLHRVEYPMDGSLEIVVAQDGCGQDRLAICHPTVAEKFFLTCFSANEIAAIRQNFGIGIRQDYFPSMVDPNFEDSRAWISLQALIAETGDKYRHLYTLLKASRTRTCDLPRREIKPIIPASTGQVTLH